MFSLVASVFARSCFFYFLLSSLCWSFCQAVFGVISFFKSALFICLFFECLCFSQVLFLFILTITPSRSFGQVFFSFAVIIPCRSLGQVMFGSIIPLWYFLFNCWIVCPDWSRSDHWFALFLLPSLTFDQLCFMCWCFVRICGQTRRQTQFCCILLFFSFLFNFLFVAMLDTDFLPFFLFFFFNFFFLWDFHFLVSNWAIFSGTGFSMVSHTFFFLLF